MKKILFLGTMLLSFVAAPLSVNAGTNIEAPMIGTRIYTLDNDPTIEQPGRWSAIAGNWILEGGSTCWNGDQRKTSTPGAYCSYYLYTGDHYGAIANLNAYLYSPAATGNARYELLAANGAVAAVTYVDQNVAFAGWNYLNRVDDFNRRDRTVLVRHSSGGIVADAIQLRLQYYDKLAEKSINMAPDKESIVNKMINSNKNYSTVEVTFNTTREKGKEKSTVTASNTNQKDNHHTNVSVTDSKGTISTKSFDNGKLSESVQGRADKSPKTIFTAQLSQKEPDPKLYTLNDLYMKNEDGTVVYNNSLDVNQLAESQNVIFPINMASTYLNETSKWNIEASENILGRDTWKIKGSLTDYQSQKEAADSFTMNVDKATGMLLSMRTYSGDKVVNQIEVTSFEVQ